MLKKSNFLSFLLCVLVLIGQVAGTLHGLEHDFEALSFGTLNSANRPIATKLSEAQFNANQRAASSHSASNLAGEAETSPHCDLCGALSAQVGAPPAAISPISAPIAVFSTRIALHAVAYVAQTAWHYYQAQAPPAAQ